MKSCLAIRFVVLMALVVFLSGCKSERGTATFSGKVSYKGSPVLFGAVYFHSPDDQVAMGVILADGTYTATDVPLGQVRVSLQIKDPGGMYGRVSEGGENRSKGVASLPAKYSDPNTSGLVYTIEKSTREINVKIE